MRLNNKNKKIEFILLIIIAIQIFLLVNMTAANSYIIHQSDPLIENIKTINENNKNKITDLIKIGTNLLIGFLIIKQIGTVSAQEIGWSCCPKTINGAICQDINSADTKSCAVNPIQYTKCEQTSACKRGCCIDKEQGLCATGSTMQECTDSNGDWDDDRSCVIEECVKACCVLGDETRFTTEKNCEYFSLQYGFSKDWRQQIKTEYECLSLSASQFKGACVSNNQSCSIKTESECLENNGNFFKDYLCSHPDITNLGVSCKKQTSVGCFEGKDEVYWFDSCRNIENIYSSDKDMSWNNGKILSKENSCNPNSGNKESETCGNCNRFLSSVCSEAKSGINIQDGDYVCKDLTCRDEKGNIRQNGESWCVYDSYIGDGKDTVGSRHWRRMCIDGEIKVEPCADYRGQICVQSNIEESGKNFSIASCTVNEAVLCLGYNSESGPTSECTENKDCMVKNVDVAENFKFSLCVPRYPRGFDVTGEERAETSSQLCTMANQECTVIYVKNFWGDWECETNCECETASFSKQMNDLCISLGDCGAYINYIGKGTDNIVVSGAPSVSWTEYIKYATPVDGQFAEPKELRGMLAAIFGLNTALPEDSENSLMNAVEMMGMISGASGLLVVAAAKAGLFGIALTETTASGAVAATGWGSFSGAAIGAAIGAYISSFIANWLGIQGDAAAAFSLAGGIVGGVMGYAYVQSAAANIKLLTFLGTCPVCIGIIAVAVLFMLYVWLIGWGDTQERIVKFECMPWQAPTGGEDCEKCNEDSLKPCTKYRCSSLGQACRLLNEDTENPICESIAYEVNPPQISPGMIIDSENISIFEPIKENSEYKFQNQETKRVEIRKSDGSCIPEWTPILFTLDTDEYAQCKFDFQRTDSDYENMKAEYPLEQTRFTINHTFGFSMPSLSALEVYNVSGDLKQMFGNINMYVRCQDYHGNFNLDEYAINFCIESGPDITPARINKYEPLSNSYIKYNTNKSSLKIYLNEPAECRYDISEGKSYDLMQNIMECETDIIMPEMYGWQCNTTLTDISKNESKFYIKCKDQPWLSAENISRNINSESFVFTLFGSKSELKIDSVLPQGEVEAGFEPVSIDLEVQTSGGAYDGKATCYYSFLGYNNTIQFFDTFSDKHKQNFNMMMQGNYNIYVKCVDDAKNEANATAQFKVNIDSYPPEVVRAYKDGSGLKLITNEEADCYYDFNRCGFNINNATSMTTGYSKTHSADWIIGKTYYVKCIDSWGNTPDGCSIKVTPSYFG